MQKEGLKKDNTYLECKIGGSSSTLQWHCTFPYMPIWIIPSYTRQLILTRMRWIWMQPDLSIQHTNTDRHMWKGLNWSWLKSKSLPGNAAQPGDGKILFLESVIANLKPVFLSAHSILAFLEQHDVVLHLILIAPSALHTNPHIQNITYKRFIKIGHCCWYWPPCQCNSLKN